MRVIAGTARSLKLKTPPGLDVRPTTDRIKETLFNIISNRVYGCNFLDLFCGSGAIGIEALSRGADSATFVDVSNTSLDCTKDNLNHTRLIDKAKVIKGDCVGSVSRLFNDGARFDIIFLDPPYNNDLEKKVLYEISKYPILSEDGIIIIEASESTEFDYLADYGFKLLREKKYGSNKHIFVEI